MRSFKNIVRTKSLGRGVSVACIGFALVLASCSALSFEKLGPTYPIAEQPADEMVLAALKKKQATGELATLQSKATQRSIASAKNPVAVSGLVPATQLSRVAIDATLTAKEDIRDPMGNLIVAAGTTINPLTMQPLTQILVFFDGRDQEQVKAVKRFVARQVKTVRPILVAGSWYELAKLWKTTVYFDQLGQLTKRFGIQQIPALIEQQGDQLILTQLPAKELH
jgi:conjugal transfer pilus assembly protein TraW